VRAIFEGVAVALREQITLLCGATPPAVVHGVGGAAGSPMWMQIKAKTLGVPVRAVACAEPTSLGAALLAWHGLTGESLAALVERCVRLAPVVLPEG
jgi:sugar (pentulose or hexulose) kinase